ncbi:membrane protein [Planctomycetota bacterium]|jgi:uncharacterized membrane protein YheB (UPF0754 family)|nr:DUF445 family protein [Planctomycetota bacterium]MSR39507.1 DUF445 family protein [Planctomycetota bacterium]GDY03305.1 membrane protein [Planctomycetota bacterium]
MDLWTWIAIPAIGGIIGWVTNWIAVKMIFRPAKARRFLGIRVQGLVGKRQPELAKAIGRVVGTHLVEHKDVLNSLNKLNLEGLLTDMLQRGLEPKVRELRSLPLIGGFLTEERVRDIRDAIAKGVMEQRDAVLVEIEKGLSAGLDVPRLVEEKVAAFPVLKLESLILEVAARELRAITWLGFVLGTLIGIGQAWLTTLR